MPVCCSSKVICKSGCCDPCCDPCCGPCCGSGCGCGSCCSSGCGCGSCCDSCCDPCCDPCCAPCCVRKKTTVTKTVCYRPVVKVVKKTVCCKTCPRVIYPALTNVNFYAAATAPADIVYISQSSLPNAGFGVFARRVIARLSFFGPYDGHRYGANPLQKMSIYSWQIPDQTGQIKYYVDAIDPNKSNWLRYINCPNTLRQQNLISFIYNNDIFYLAIRNIPAGEELLVYYGHSYAKKLGIDTTQFP
ncbi:unnamed protein product [Adineta ricciae]|uniref:SET domain-containing protein n=1 Tax=Adineta ricciae TaxID=249248 RepID=A0A816ENZ2_ADIRI|nr:unnamed protein product [Adineta ricciae]